MVGNFRMVQIFTVKVFQRVDFWTWRSLSITVVSVS